MGEVEEACKLLNKSMKGLGTDESLLIKQIVGHNNATRQLIKRRYLALYGKTLEDHIKSEISGHFLDGVLALLEPSDEYEAKCIRKAIQGLGTNEKVLIQTICSKEGYEIKNLKATYKRLFNNDLETDLKGDTSHHVRYLLCSLVSHGREDGMRDVSIKDEAEELYNAGIGKHAGTEDSVFIRILSSRSFSHLNYLFDAYKRSYGNDIEEVIKKEMSGDLKFACLTIIKAARNKSEYFAEQLHDAMKGLGTDDGDLIRILVSRSEVDLGKIKQLYKSMFGKTLYDAVKSELSGDYEKLFLTLIGKD